MDDTKFTTPGSYEGNGEHDFVGDELPDAGNVVQGVYVQVRKLKHEPEQAEQLKQKVKF